MRKCENCIFWEQGVDEKILNRGMCRRFPPSSFCAFESQTPFSDGSYHVTNFVGQWTFRMGEDWCGEFKQRELK